jgi:predicted DNA-binding protein (MmcQ/YjbR family)
MGEAEPRYGFKCSDGSFEQLIAEGVAQPAPYAARFKWVQLTRPDALPDDELRRYLQIAHGLVAAKLTRKARAELGLVTSPAR